MIRNHMRELGRLVQEARKTEKDTELYDLIHTVNYDRMKQAVKALCGYNAKTHTYENDYKV